jgi:curved DNA-binding protein CbpA
VTLYDDLGVEPDADERSIRSAYRRLSKKHHPDVGGNEDDFKRIVHAYEVLIDPERRKLYDETGAEEAPRDIVTAKAMEFLARAFEQAVSGGTMTTIVVEELKHVDVPKEMKRYLDADAKRMDEVNAAGLKCREAIVEMTVRVEKSPDRDVFAELLASKIKKIDAELNLVVTAMKAYRRASAMLDGYAYRVDPRRQKTPPSFATLDLRASTTKIFWDDKGG